LQQALLGGGLLAPYGAEVGPGLERIEPQDQPDHHGEGGADDDQPAVDLEEEPVERKNQGRNGAEEGGEYEDGVDEDCYDTGVRD
jgi:hypothetical protein